MSHISSRKLRYLLIIILPALIASAGVLFHSKYLINKVVAEANASEQELNGGLARSAIEAKRSELAKLALDNGFWDEAVANTYLQRNAEWMASNFGSTTGDADYPFDMTIILDGNTRMPIAMFRLGELVSEDLSVAMRSGLATAINELPSAPNERGSKTAIVKTTYGIAIAAAAPIVGYSEKYFIKTGRPNYLVLLSHLTDEKVAALGQQYLLDGLKFSIEPHTGSNAQSFLHANKDPAFSLYWNEKREGDRMGKELWPIALLSFGFLTVVLSGMIAMVWNLLNKTMNAEENAVSDSKRDRLTGLPNRKGLEEKIVAMQAGGKHLLSVAFLDLDGFKDVNDTFGHQFGDLILQEVSVLMRKIASEADVICRLGGDEFIAVFEGENAEMKARVFSDTLIEAVGKPFDFGGRIASIGVSIGIASVDESTIQPDEILRRADVAMYKCKALGKNQYFVYRPFLDGERIESREIAQELKQIIKDNGIEVAFQPIVEASSGNVTCVEVLARWPSNHERKVGPDRFISVAENSGLIDQLGLQILHKAVRAAKNWGDMTLAVNVSAIQFNNPRFSEQVLEILESNSVDPSRVELEITESVLLKNAETAKRAMEKLRKRGVRFALDDFGSGYSGISYLEKLSFDRVKIDRSITKRALSQAGEQSLVQGIVLISRALDATITAEGIETAEEASLLRLAGCTELQGYHFYLPMNETDANNLLSPNTGKRAETAGLGLYAKTAKG